MEVKYKLFDVILIPRIYKARKWKLIIKNWVDATFLINSNSRPALWTEGKLFIKLAYFDQT